MTGPRPRNLLAAVCALLAAVCAAAASLAGCGSPHAAAPSAGARSPSVGPATGLIPAPHGLTDWLVLRQARVAAGTPIKGTLIVAYRGRAPINLNRRCRPKYAVVLTNQRFPPAAAFTSDCSMAPFIIRPGVNRLAVTVITTYDACSKVASQATSSSPACRPGPQPMPPLPHGRYEAVLMGGGGLPLPAPAPIPVILDPGPGGG
jgi:hypothetical protein